MMSLLLARTSWGETRRECMHGIRVHAYNMDITEYVCLSAGSPKSARNNAWIRASTTADRSPAEARHSRTSIQEVSSGPLFLSCPKLVRTPV